MSDYEVKVTIYDEDIPPFWLKKIQKLKAVLLEKPWHVGAIEQDKNIIRYYQSQVLDQDIRIYWYSHQTIRILTGHDIDRGNLKIMERVLGRIAQIDVEKDEIELSFNCSKGANEPNEYEKFKSFKDKNYIPRMLDGHKVEIYGYKWNDQINV